MLDLGLLEIIIVLFLSTEGGSKLTGHYPNPMPNPAGQSYPLLNLTCPKLSIKIIIFNNPYKHILPESAPDPNLLFHVFYF